MIAVFGIFFLVVICWKNSNSAERFGTKISPRTICKTIWTTFNEFSDDDEDVHEHSKTFANLGRRRWTGRLTRTATRWKYFFSF